MKTYHERTKDILERIEKQKRLKQKRRKQIDTAGLWAVCLAITVPAAIAIPSILHRPAAPPAPNSGDAPSLFTPSISTPVTPPITPPTASTPPNTPHFSITQKRVSYKEAKQALGWNIRPCTEDGFIEYVLLFLNKSDQPAGLSYRFQNGSVRILSVSSQEPTEREYRRVNYRGKEFLVFPGSTKTTALYRDESLIYTASFMETTQEETFDKILSLLIPYDITKE